MIKLVYVIARRPELSRQAFAEYWLDRHGPLVANHAGALRMRKYVQSHLFEHPSNEGMRAARGMRPATDGITEVWWDSLEAFRAAYATPDGAAAGAELAADEARFIDPAGSTVFLTQEHEIFDRTDGAGPGPDALKVTYLLARRNDLTQAACHETWLKDHGPLVRSFAEPLHMAKYVQSHTIAPELNAGFRAARGFEPPLDGITEVWMNTLADLEAGGATEAGRRGGAALVEDERRFVQMDASRCFLTREHVIFDSTR
ncbi:EthD domain-containing protein [Phenylobacterium sp.]|uniref:EthD domain-containing protein n=1 Tax=Phenylobacterium sp. TaxID=1871053 RepID=UPI00301DDBA9